MQHLMVDIMRRAWYVIFPAFALSALLSATGHSGYAAVLFTVGPIILKLDRENRTSTTLQTLPASSAMIAGAYWFTGVLFFSTLNLVWCPAIALLTNGPRMETWPHVLITFIGAGYASLMTLVVARLPRTPVETTFAKETFGLIWIGLLFGSLLLPSFLAAGYEANEPWFYAALAASPALMLVSYVSAVDFIAKRPSGSTERRPSLIRLGYHKGLVPLEIVAGAAAVGFCFALALTPLLLYFAHSRYTQFMPELIPFHFLLLVLGTAAFNAKWTNAMRAIRMLPRSSAQLSAAMAALHSVSLLTGIGMLSLLLPRINGPGVVWGTSAYLAIGLALSLCINTLTMRFDIRVVSVMPSVMMFMCMRMPPTPLLVPIALLIALGAFYATIHLLKTSSAVYRPKYHGKDLTQH